MTSLISSGSHANACVRAFLLYLDDEWQSLLNIGICSYCCCNNAVMSFEQ